MADIMLFSASWFTYQGPGRVGISRGTPRGIPAGFRIFKHLRPAADMLNMDHAPYRKRYFSEILAGLDPQSVLDDLTRLAGSDHPPVVLCYERPPLHANNWCHRTMVREWLEDHLGIATAEWDKKLHSPEATAQGALI